MKTFEVNPGHAQVVYKGWHPVYKIVCFQETSDGHSFEDEHFTFELFHCSKDGEPDSPIDIDSAFLTAIPLPRPDTRFKRNFIRFILDQLDRIQPQ